MTGAEKIDPVDIRDRIREKAFCMAESDIFADWAAVKLALSAECAADHLNHVFASAFCRLDLNQRCLAARMGCPRGDTSPGRASPGIHRKITAQPGPAQKSAQFARLVCEIAAALGDGNARTAVDLAAQLGAEARNVRRALRAMLADGEIHVSGRVPRPGGGTTARLFALGREVVRAGNAVRVWAKPDPVVLQAMDAFARHA